jgi:Txe/YoeB family toxin of Txe-Axe toxin-antitoxin module
MDEYNKVNGNQMKRRLEKLVSKEYRHDSHTMRYFPLSWNLLGCWSRAKEKNVDENESLDVHIGKGNGD